MRKSALRKKNKFYLGYLLASVALLITLGLLGFKIMEQAKKQKMIDDEIAALEQEVLKLNTENKELTELNNYFNTTEFKEKEAKDKLNLVKEGEQLVLVKGVTNEKEDGLDFAEEARKAKIIMERSNAYWWWHYFFGLKE
ncbi:MAG TPA: septum formation initiator family protein [Candidatus Moranbacteria bacterium]|nr:septum formation initiator family protein [Candidatus Moranbacteria bacterium]